MWCVRLPFADSVGKPFCFLLSILYCCIVLPGCSGNRGEVRTVADLSDFEHRTVPAYRLQGDRVRRAVDSLSREPQRMYADAYVRRYYASRGSFLWITRNGVERQADSLLAMLESMPEEGIPLPCFSAEDIKEDIRQVRELDFGRGNDINTVFGRLEYRLTKALLRYACGQHYGYVRPDRILNHLEPADTMPDAPFKRLYAIPTEQADEAFVRQVLQALQSGRLPDLLREIQPQNPEFFLLAGAFRTETDPKKKERIAVNMERCRWRTPRPAGKHVRVNLAAMNLVALNPDKGDTLRMKVCGGDLKHKSPMLVSKIERMDLNPYWIVPYSIIKKEIAPLHAQSVAYFSRNNIRIFDKETGAEADPADVTAAMLTSGRYRLRQDNGQGNSLGRLIFRFPNEFSVFLHDTNNKAAFGRTNRAISHGCIRVEKPLELALFLWETDDEEAIDRLRTEIGLPALHAGRKKTDGDETPKADSRHFDVPIPVFIDYYTAIPALRGGVDFYPDIYGYDEVLLESLKAY